MSPITSVTASTKTNLGVYGNPGVGKTELIGTHPRTLVLRPPQDHTDSITDARVKEWIIRGWAEMDEAFEFCRHEAASQFDWVWLDSVSLWQDVGVDDIWQNVLAEKPHRAKWGKDKGEYGRNMDRLSEWFRGMVELPGFNFGFTAHPFEATTADGEVMFAPFVQGKNMAFKISGYMNLIGLMRNDAKGRRVIDFNPHEDYLAMNKLGLFAPRGRLVNPTMGKIMKAIDEARAARVPAKPARRRSTRRKTDN